jgi:hypothetical protein
MKVQLGQATLEAGRPVLVQVRRPRVSPQEIPQDDPADRTTVLMGR